MKNVYVTICVILLVQTAGFSQAYVTQTGKGKSLQPAAAVRLAFNTDIVEDALKAYLSKKGYSSSHARGYILSRAVPLGDGDGNDLYFSTSTPDRKVKDNTELVLIPAKKNADIGNGAFVDSSKLTQASAFLDEFTPFVKAYGINTQLTTQQDGLLKAQKKMTNLRNDSSDLEKRLRNLQSDLTENKSDQVKAASDLQTYVGNDNDKKFKYQKKLNNLLDKQGSLEKKIRNTESDLAEKKSDMVKQQDAVDQMQHALDATKERQN